MKKGLKLMPCVLALAAALLGGCRGGSSNGQAAVDKVMGGNVCMLNGVTPIVSGTTSECSGDTNDYVQVVTKQIVAVNDAKVTVDVAWSYAGFEADVFRFRTIDGDDYHKNFEFNYPAIGAAAKAIEIVATPSVDGKAFTAVKFSLSLKAMTVNFPEWSISKIYELNDEGTMFKHVSDATKGYYEGTQPEGTDPNYCYIKTYGEVVYLAPDGNWGLIADGEKWIEIYAGAAYNLSSKTYADLKVGAKVYVYGEVTHYLGNVQVGYISKVVEMSDPQRVTAPSAVKTLDEAFFTANKQICQDMNRFVTVSGKFKSKSISVDSARGTFVITIGSKDVTIAYDYHTAKEGSSTLFSEMKTILDSATTATTITVKGTLRWANTSKEASPVYGNTAGMWTVVPYLPGHVA